eukprot:220882-Prymnesium_polylepis.1
MHGLHGTVKSAGDSPGEHPDPGAVIPAPAVAGENVAVRDRRRTAARGYEKSTLPIMALQRMRADGRRQDAESAGRLEVHVLSRGGGA